MSLDQRFVFRISSAERDLLNQAAKSLGLSPSVAMRIFLRDGLKSFDKAHQELLLRLDALQTQVERNHGLLEALGKDADGAYLMAASAVGLLAALELPQIAEKTQDDLVARIRSTMRLATKMGSELKAAHSAGKPI